MAGEIVKTEGIVLAIHPWSQTSHVVEWLTPDAGVVTTSVKGAVRPKSAFLGQYDLFYSCDLLYYARAHGEVHALREASPLNLRERLRGDWRAAVLAGYAADLAGDLTPPSAEAEAWYRFLSAFLDRVGGGNPLAELLAFEMEALELAGLAPDFSQVDSAADWIPFAIDLGRVGENGTRVVRLSPRSAQLLACRAQALDAATAAELADASRFLGLFLAYHLDRAHETRRELVKLLKTDPRPDGNRRNASPNDIIPKVGANCGIISPRKKE